jgi:DNA-binding MarR family transcriptional regulator
MNKDTKPNLTIGYWLKQVDNLLNEQINRVHAASGITRSDWQVLKILSEMGTGTWQQIFESMRTFVDEFGLERILSGLLGRGWVAKSEIPELSATDYQLTDEGKQQHAILLARQKEVWKRSMQGADRI